MSYLYKSTTGSAVNAGSYVVSVSGTSFSEAVPMLEALVGTTLTRETEEAVVEAPVAPVVTKAPSVTKGN